MFGTVALFSTLAGLAAAAPVAVESNSTPKVYGNLDASFWWDGVYSGSCGYTNSTKQYIASVKKSGDSSACGKTVNITSSEQGKWVLAMVVDEAADVPESYLNISRVTFQDFHNLEKETFAASYTFVDAAVPEWVEPAASASTPKQQSSEPKPKAVAPAAPAPSSSSSSSAKSAPSSSKKVEQAHYAPAAPATTSSSEKVEQQKKYTPPSTTSSSKKVEQQKQYTPPTITSSSKKQVYTPKTTEVKKPAYTPKTTSSKKAAETKPASGGNSGGQFSGRGTWFTQGGNAGACGNVNSDSAYIVAVNSAQYAGGSHCGQSVRISSGGKSITARVADLCPGCPYGGLDLSTGAFQALGSLGQGVLPLSWSWA